MTISKSHREDLPKSDFGLPSKAKGKSKGEPGNYPIDTPGRARSALSRAAANATPAEQVTIRARVHRKYPSIQVEGKSNTDKSRKKS